MIEKQNEDTKSPRTIRREVVITVPSFKVPKILAPLQGFVNFVREQGVIGLAVGLVLGTQIKALVDQFIASFINPLLGLLLPGKGSLAEKVFVLNFHGKTQQFLWGAFAAQFLSFAVVVATIYFLVKGLKLDKIDKKKEK